MGKSELVSENIDGVLKRILNSYKDLSEERSLRLDVFKEIKLGCFNAIKMHQEKSLQKFFSILSLISIQEFDQSRDTFAEDALEALLIILSFAFLDSEFYTSSKSFEIVEGIFAKLTNADKLVRIFQLMTKQYTPEWTLKYHNWFKDIFIKRSELPTVAKRREGFKSVDFVYDHPSQFIQRTYHIGIDNCAEAMIEKLLRRLKKSGKPVKSKSKRKRGKT